MKPFGVVLWPHQSGFDPAQVTKIVSDHVRLTHLPWKGGASFGLLWLWTMIPFSREHPSNSFPVDFPDSPTP